MAGRFSVEAVFKAVDRITAPVSRMQNRVGKFARSMERSFHGVNRAVGRLSDGIKRAGRASAVALTAVGAAAASVIKTGATFQQSIVNATARFPGDIKRGAEAFEELSQSARKVGATTEFTASQAAEAINFLAMAGFNAQSAMAALPGVVDLATAASSSLARATDIATDSLGSFNLLTKDPEQLIKNLTRVNDVLARTSTSANTTIEQMFEAIKQGAPAGVAAGQSLETIAAMIGTMANAGIKGERAGTGLKNIFLAIGAPASTAAKIMKRLGVQTQDSNGAVRDALSVFRDFNKAVKTLPNSKQIAIFDEIFGKIPLAAAINISNASESATELRESLLGAAGASEKMASIIRDTVRGRLNALKSAVESVAISIFDMNEGPLADVIDRMTAWVRANERLIATRVTQFIVELTTELPKIAEGLADIAKAALGILALNVAFKAVAGTIALINFLMLRNPITLAIMAAVTAVGVLAGALDPVWQVVKAIVRGVTTAVNFISGRDDDETSDVDGVTGPTARSEIVNLQAAGLEQSFRDMLAGGAGTLVIKDESGRAELDPGKMGGRLKLQHSGATD